MSSPHEHAFTLGSQQKTKGGLNQQLVAHKSGQVLPLFKNEEFAQIKIEFFYKGADLTPMAAATCGR